MKLYFRKIGEGKPLIILHGLFGLGDNWATLAKSFSENGFCSYLVDLRNHGRSFHSEVFNYDVMADDIYELMKEENISKADIIGHSMGGKAAMFLAKKYPAKISKMIIADIAPRFYPQHHQAIFSALRSIDLSEIKSRKEVETSLRNALSDEATIQLLLKNLYWISDEKLGWRFGFLEIEKNIEEIGKALPDSVINVPVLFLRGERSGYITKEDEVSIRKIFPRSEIKKIPHAGHWLHAENPESFLETALGFL